MTVHAYNNSATKDGSCQSGIEIECQQESGEHCRSRLGNPSLVHQVNATTTAIGAFDPSVGPTNSLTAHDLTELVHQLFIGLKPKQLQTVAPVRHLSFPVLYPMLTAVCRGASVSNQADSERDDKALSNPARSTEND